MNECFEKMLVDIVFFFLVPHSDFTIFFVCLCHAARYATFSVLVSHQIAPPLCLQLFLIRRLGLWFAQVGE